MAANLSAAQRIEIEWACEKLVRQYALYVDAGDYDLLEGLFARDAIFARPTAPEEPIQGRGAIIAGFRNRPGGRVTRHIVAGCVVQADDTASAHGSSYMVLYQGPLGAEGDISVMDKPPLIGGFDDRFVFEDGAWRFLMRIGSLSLKAG